MVQDVRHLRHLHHKGGLAGGEVIAGADSGEDAVHHADVGLGRRDKAAHLGHEDDQRHLAHVSRFARHVGAGDDGHPVLFFAHKGVVGDEKRVLEHLFHHRVAALADLDDAGLVHVGAAVVVSHRHGGEGGQGIDLRHRRGGFLDAGGRVGDLLTQLREQLVFQGHHPLGGRQDLVLQILQLLGDEPLAVHQCLLADVCIRHLVLKGVADFNVIAEHLVVADLQGADAGGLFLLGLHLRDDALAALQDVPQAVHLFVKAVPDEAALPDGKRRLVADGSGDALADIVQSVQLRRQLAQAAVGKGGQLLLHSGQLFDGRPEGGHVPPAGGAVDDAADKPLHVPQARHGGDQLLPGDGVVHQSADGGVPLADGGDAEQGPLQPGPEAPGAHGRFGLVQHPEKTPLFLLVPQGLRQFQVPAGRQVQLHEPALLVVVQVVDMGEVRFLCLVQIIQQTAQGHGRRRISGGQVFQGVLTKLFADVFLRLRQQEPPFAAVFGAAVEFVRQGVGQGLFRVCAVVQDGLRRGEAAQLIDDMLHPVFSSKGRQVGLAGGNVAEGGSGGAGVDINTADEVAGLVIQAGGVDDGAGRHHPDDVPLDKALCRGRVLHLLADGHLVALGDEPGDVGLAGVVGDAAHGDLLLRRLGVLAVVPGGQCQVQFPGRKAGIVVEHLVKIAQPEEQDGIRIVLFDLQVLLHHGGQFRHELTSLSFYLYETLL